jgi:hypothetical protein
MKYDSEMGKENHCLAIYDAGNQHEVDSENNYFLI